MTKNNSMHWVLGGALLLIGLFVIVALILVRSQADTSYPQASVGVDNEAPIVSASDIKICEGAATAGQYSGCSDISDNIILTAGGTDTNTIVFIARDGNGTSDLPATADDATFFMSVGASPAGNTCTQDNNYCYENLTCTKGFSVGGSATASYYGCSLDLAYYAVQTIQGGAFWSSWVQISDVAGSTAYATAVNQEMAVLLAASFGNIPFGTKSLGYEGEAGEAVTVTHYNNGNKINDFDVIANSDLGCSTLGTIQASAIKFSELANQSWSGSGYVLSRDATVDFANLNSPIRQNDSSTSAHADYSYWQIKIPDSGIAGTCNATITAITTD